MSERTDGPVTGDLTEVCVVGAGITGLNALVVARDHLPIGAKVVLADSRPQVGGMWVDTYDHVRLHQPHPIFTAGNIAWTGGRPREHLASKHEVLDHFHHCLQVARQHLDVDVRLGSTYVSHDDTGSQVVVRLRSPDGATHEIRTRRLIKAFGHQVTPNSPLEVSSARVRSITPEQLDSRRDEMVADDAPVWIVGSGKTAMDAAAMLIAAFPGREIHMAAGPGTMFARRETFFPAGARRWWSGTLINAMLRQVARRFDGTNEDEVRDWFRRTYGLALTDAPKDFFSAYLSERELRQIEAGLSSVEVDYLRDAVDGGDGVDLVFRSGAIRRVPAGVWLVNCTGSLLRTSHPYEPFVSATGRVLSLQMRSSTTGVFSSFAGYYLTHLLFTGALGSIGLYALDVEELYAKAKPVVIYASMSLASHNLSLISDALPVRTILGCGLDYDRWYPLPRRMLGAAAFLRTHHRDREHQRRTLDIVGDRFGVRSGPLTAPAAT